MKRKKVAEAVLLLLISAVLLFGIPNYVMERVIVDGPSMETTLQDGDNILVEKISRYFGALDRFDVVVFYPDEEAKESDGKYYVKRIIGLPGETVRIEGNSIYIDDVLLEESYGSTEMGQAGIAADSVSLGEDEYFVLGDNRAISKDSRSASLGAVPLSRMEGRLVLRIFPLRKFGAVDK